MIANAVGNGRRRRQVQFLERHIGFDDGVNIVDMDKAVAESSWRLLIHFSNDKTRACCSSFNHIDADAKAAKTLSVRRADLN